MAPFCQARQVWLLAYGTLCGGLLSDAYLGQPEPARAALNTSSLMKYKQMIDAWGGWALFQQLLQALRRIADRHQVSIANVATRYILDQPAVAGVIVGVRLGLSDHHADNAAVFSFQLEAADLAELEPILAQSRDLYAMIGDCGDEYR
jgi:aryl-alcohol dehydrogenase-like predicted oxidoreductase